MGGLITTVLGWNVAFVGIMLILCGFCFIATSTLIYALQIPGN